MTKSETDESKDHDAPSPASGEDAVALSTRDVELEPVSLRDIEMILAPGKVPPPMSLAQKEAKAKGDNVQKSPSVPPHRPPVKVRGAKPEPPPVPKAPRMPTQSVISPPKPTEPRKIPVPAARREESATVDLASLLSGRPKSTRPATASSNADVVIGAPRAPKPIPKPPLKRASIPDDGSVTLPKLDAEAKATAKGAPDDAKLVIGPDSGDLPIVDARMADDEPVGANTLIDDGPHALEAFLTDDAPSQDAQATTAKGAVEASEPEGETEPAAKPKLALKPPRKQPSATAEKPEEPEAKDAKEREPRPSSRPRRSSAPVSATSARPRSVKPAAPAEEKRSRVGIFAAAAVICGGLVVFAATRGDDPVAKPAPSATAAREPTGAPQPTTPPTAAQNPSPQPMASVEPTASSEPAPTSTTTSTVVPTGRLVSTETTPPTATTPPTSTSTQTSAPVGTAPFDVGAANAALSGSMGRAAGCKQPGDPSGVAKVSVTFSTSGRVTQAMVAGPPFAGTPTGGCIANAFRSATVPPFTGDKVTVQKTVNIP